MSKLREEQDRICPPQRGEMIGVILMAVAFAIVLALNVPEPAAEADVAAMRAAVAGE